MKIALDLRPLIAETSGGIVPWLGGVLGAYAKRFPDDEFLILKTPGLPRHGLEAAAPKVVEAPAERLYAAGAARLAAFQPDIMLRAYPEVDSPDFPLDRQIV